MSVAGKQEKRAPSGRRRRTDLAGGAQWRERLTSGQRQRADGAVVRSVPGPCPLRCAPPARSIRCSILSRIELTMDRASKVVGCGGHVSPPLLSLVHLTPPPLIFPVPQKPRLAAPSQDLGPAPRSRPRGADLELPALSEPRPPPGGRLAIDPRPRPADRPLFRPDPLAASRSCRPRPCRRPGRRRCSAGCRSTLASETRSRRPGATGAYRQEFTRPCRPKTNPSVGRRPTSAASC